MGGYRPASIPTMYFIGVTTGRSSIMRIFPEWASHLRLGDCELRGIDFPPHAPLDAYRDAVRFIKDDPLSLGALVTTHKIDLLEACRDLFDELDGDAELLGEVSGISKRDGALVGHAEDAAASGLALAAAVPPGHWEESGAELLLLGAGGSAVALSAFLLQGGWGKDRPSRILVTERRPGRLLAMRAIHGKIGPDIACAYRLASSPADNDRELATLKPGSLVVNATGLGKDAPGSPLTGRALFPERGIAWDFNYRGELEFLDLARSQERSRRLRIEDGWVYFLHGWTRVIAEVFHVAIPGSGPEFEKLAAIAARHRLREARR